MAGISSKLLQSYCRPQRSVRILPYLRRYCLAPHPDFRVARRLKSKPRTSTFLNSIQCLHFANGNSIQAYTQHVTILKIRIQLQGGLGRRDPRSLSHSCSGHMRLPQTLIVEFTTSCTESRRWTDAVGWSPTGSFSIHLPRRRRRGRRDRTDQSRR